MVVTDKAVRRNHGNSTSTAICACITSSNPLVSAAYANTAKTTSPLAGVGAAFDGDGPLAGRAKWLAEQVAARTGMVTPPTAGQPVDELMALRDGPMPRMSKPDTTRPARYVDVDPVAPVAVDNDIASLRESVQMLSDKLAGLNGEVFGHCGGSGNHEEIMTERLEGIGLARDYAAKMSQRAFVEVPEATCEDGDLIRSIESLTSEDISEYQSQHDEIANARIVAFVGATGIGKTTTIAKLATQAKLRKSVALITLDTIRLAAVDQLTRFFRSAECPAESGCTPIRIDTGHRRFSRV